MRWSRSPLIVVVGAVVLGLGAWWGLARQADPPAEPSATRLQLDVGEILDRVPGCMRTTCRVVDRRDGFELDGRPVTVIVVDEPGRCGHLAPASVHVVDSSSPLWSGPRDSVCGDPVGGIQVDESGNAFLAFPTVDGATKLVVLRVEGDDVDDFGTFDDRFRGERVAVDDVEGDGIYEIVAGGGGEEGDPRVYRWNGSAYAERA